MPPAAPPRLLVCLFVLSLTSFAWSSDLTPGELIARHLASMGTPQARNVKTRVAQGSVLYKVLVGGAGQAAGNAYLISEGGKRRILLKIQDRSYRGEEWIFNGDKNQVTFTLPQQTRSQIGKFLFTQDMPQREGLLGGVLTASWPLLDLEDREPKLSYKGLKKADGRDLHDLVYQPKKRSDYLVHLYFDPETFHHVMSVYTIEIAPQMKFGGDARNVLQTPERHRIEERFSDFKQFDGVTLPTHYDLQYAQELQTGGTTLFEYDMTFNQIMNNGGVDARNFEVK